MLLHENIEEKEKQACNTFAKLDGNYFAKMDQKKNYTIY